MKVEVNGGAEPTKDELATDSHLIKVNMNTNRDSGFFFKSVASESKKNTKNHIDIGFH